MRTCIAFLLAFALSGPLFAQNSKLPELNKKIVDYVSSVIGTTVDRGECWDLANQALSATGAYFNRSSKKTIYTFGKEIDSSKQEVLPGDIVQFTNVKLQYEKDNAIYTETMTHHTAIIYKVYEKGRYQLAHQNTGFSGRKVGLSDFNIADMKTGKIKIYRPYR